MNMVYGSIFVSHSNRMLLVRGKATGKWSFPKGHPNPNETEFQCAARETKEETGLTLPPLFERVLHLATGIYYLVRTSEYPCKIQDPNEISEIAWMSLSELRTKSVNVDVNTFLREYGELIQAPTQRKTTNTIIRPKPLLL